MRALEAVLPPGVVQAVVAEAVQVVVAEEAQAETAVQAEAVAPAEEEEVVPAVGVEPAEAEPQRREARMARDSSRSVDHFWFDSFFN